MSETEESNHSEVNWISWFCSLEDHQFFCELDHEFITDRFNQYGLKNKFNHFELSNQLSHGNDHQRNLSD